jgi:hypothetical protein
MVEGGLKEAAEGVAGVCEWFTKEAIDLGLVYTTGGAPVRYFVPINEPRRERIAMILARALRYFRFG